MSENLNHETGGTFATGDVVTEGSGNVKYICIQSANPTTPYDGEIFIDTDDDPPKIRVYDASNTQYMTKQQVEYEASTKQFVPDTDASGVTDGVPRPNGYLITRYDSNQSKSILWIRANDWWWAATTG